MDLGQFDSAGDLLSGTDLSMVGVHDGTSCVRHDATDLDSWKHVVAAVPGYAALVEEARGAGVGGEALLRDLYFTLYKRFPELKPPTPLRPSHAANMQILASVMESVSWKDCRDSGTVDRAYPSAMAVKILAPRLLKILSAAYPEASALAGREEEVAALLARAETLEDVAARSPDKAKGLYDQAERVRAEAVAAQGQLMPLELDPSTMEEVDRSVRFGLIEANLVVDEDGKALEAFSVDYVGGHGTSPGQYRRKMDLGDHLKLAERVKKSRRAKQVAALCGRLTRIALHKQRTKITVMPTEIVGIEFGNDLARILPSEMVFGADPASRDLFALKYVTGQLMQYTVDDKEKLGQGPIIVIEDQSSSEHTPYGAHTGVVYNKAATLALAAIAQLQQRDLAIIEFSGKGNLRTSVFPKGRIDPGEAIDFTDRLFNGGTWYEDWMTEALRLTGESKFDRADCILLSDGLVHIQEESAATWNAMRHERGMKLYAVMTGPETIHAQRVIGGICDAVVQMMDLADDGEAVDTMFSI